MKIRILFFFMFILNTLISFSQVKDSLKNTQAVVSLTGINVLYICIKNPVIVDVPGYSSDRIYCKLENDDTLIGDSGNYVIIPSDTRMIYRKVRLDIFIRNPDKSLTYVDSKWYRLKYLRKPEIYFGSKQTGEKISTAELKLIKYLRAAIMDFDYEGIQFHVTKFKFTYIPKRGRNKTYNCTEAIFSKEILEIINNCRAGDRFEFTDIYVKNSENCCRVCPEIRTKDAFYEVYKL
jgi:hypothetical protein